VPFCPAHNNFTHYLHKLSTRRLKSHTIDNVKRQIVEIVKLQHFTFQQVKPSYRCDSNTQCEFPDEPCLAENWDDGAIPRWRSRDLNLIGLFTISACDRQTDLLCHWKAAKRSKNSAVVCRFEFEFSTSDFLTHVCGCYLSITMPYFHFFRSISGHQQERLARFCAEVHSATVSHRNWEVEQTLAKFGKYRCTYLKLDAPVSLRYIFVGIS